MCGIQLYFTSQQQILWVLNLAVQEGTQMVARVTLMVVILSVVC